MLLDVNQLQNAIMFACDFGDNESVLARIRYKGDEASGIIDIASTGDITFKHGDASSEAADDDTKLDADGDGIIDMSDDVTDYNSLERKVNLSDNWEMWLVGALPDADPHTTTTGHFTEVTGGDCNGVNGYAILTDDSDSLYINAGITQQGPSTKVHATDHNVLHVIDRIIALSTFGSGTSALKVYACDDDDGSKEEILSLPAGATTVEVAYPTETYPKDEIGLAWTRGKRLVVQLLNSAAIGTVRLKVEGRSYKTGPSIRRSKMMDQY